MVLCYITVWNPEEYILAKPSEEKALSSQRIIIIVLLIIVLVLVTGIGVYVSKYTLSVLVFVIGSA